MTFIKNKLDNFANPFTKFSIKRKGLGTAILLPIIFSMILIPSSNPIPLAMADTPRSEPLTDADIAEIKGAIQDRRIKIIEKTVELQDPDLSDLAIENLETGVNGVGGIAGLQGNIDILQGLLDNPQTTHGDWLDAKQRICVPAKMLDVSLAGFQLYRSVIEGFIVFLGTGKLPLDVVYDTLDFMIEASEAVEDTEAVDTLTTIKEAIELVEEVKDAKDKLKGAKADLDKAMEDLDELILDKLKEKAKDSTWDWLKLQWEQMSYNQCDGINQVLVAYSEPVSCTQGEIYDDITGTCLQWECADGLWDNVTYDVTDPDNWIELDDYVTTDQCDFNVTVGGIDAMGHTEVYMTGLLGGDSNQTGDLTFRITDQYDLYTDTTLQDAVGGQPFEATVAHLMPTEDGPQNYSIGIVSGDGNVSFNQTLEYPPKPVVGPCLDLRTPGMTHVLEVDIETETDCFTINADDITLDCGGHKITSVLFKENTGILLNGTTGVTVKNCVIYDFENLIMLDGSHRNTISNNNLFNSGTFGVGLAHSYENNIFDNSGSGNDFLVGGFGMHDNIIEFNNANNGQNGMGIDGDRNIIRENQLDNNDLLGLGIFGSNNTIMENSISGNSDTGLDLFGSNNIIMKNQINFNELRGLTIEGFENTIMDNEISGNKDTGLGLFGSNNIIRENIIFQNDLGGLTIEGFENTIMDNEIGSNADGLILFGDKNIIMHNSIMDNDFGLSLDNSNQNVIQQNSFIDNSGQVRFLGTSNNIWNGNMTEGGNYWNLFDEAGEGCLDADGNGICDSPFDLGNNQEDKLPWVKPSGWLNPPQPPTVDPVPPEPTFEVTVLIMDEKKYPITQFEIWKWLGECNDAWHYHTPTGHAVSLQNTVKNDPDQLNCGYGKVSELPKEIITMTESEVNEFKGQTGINPVGSEPMFGGKGP